MMRSTALHVLALVAATQAVPVIEFVEPTEATGRPLSLPLRSLRSAQHIQDATPSSSRTRSASSVRLRNEMRNALIAVEVTIGTPPQPFKVQLDTGSPSLWVFGEHCYTCTTQTRYDRSSATFSDVGRWDYQSFGGGRVPMQYARDTVRVGDHETSTQFEFGVAAGFEDGRYSSMMASGIEGILGFSRPFEGRPPPMWMDVLNDLPEKRFGLHLQREGETFRARRGGQPISFDGGELTLGGINETLTDGPPISLDVRDVDGFWATTLGGMNVNGRKLGLSTDVGILDSGDSYISFNPGDYAAFMESIDAEPLGPEWDETGYRGMHALPCSALDELQVSFVFAGQDIEVHPYDLVTPIDGVCILANVNVVEHAQGLLLGVPFLMNVYTVFGLDPPSLEFYRLKEQFNPGWQLRITSDGEVVRPQHALIGLGWALMPSELAFAVCFLTLAVMGGLFISAVLPLSRRRHRKNADAYKYAILQRVPAMGW